MRARYGEDIEILHSPLLLKEIEETFGGFQLVLACPGYGPGQNCSSLPPPSPASVLLAASSACRKLHCRLDASAPASAEGQPDASAPAPVCAGGQLDAAAPAPEERLSVPFSKGFEDEPSPLPVPVPEGYQDEPPLSFETQWLCCRSSGLHRSPVPLRGFQLSLRHSPKLLRGFNRLPRHSPELFRGPRSSELFRGPRPPELFRADRAPKLCH
ncbi:hypothetical protein ILYODFUR_032644 [Ilyodon furcidens]|uniref:Uncharacterized protein n=1 Tax=Ilyodon furcidens TaxID=33524 RepID=A0ABV0TQD4_9TELE